MLITNLLKFNVDTTFTADNSAQAHLLGSTGHQGKYPYVYVCIVLKNDDGSFNIEFIEKGITNLKDIMDIPFKYSKEINENDYIKTTNKFPNNYPTKFVCFTDVLIIWTKIIEINKKLCEITNKDTRQKEASLLFVNNQIFV